MQYIKAHLLVLFIAVDFGEKMINQYETFLCWYDSLHVWGGSSFVILGGGGVTQTQN